VGYYLHNISSGGRSFNGINFIAEYPGMTIQNPVAYFLIKDDFRHSGKSNK
jgi:hypothetical protein